MWAKARPWWIAVLAGYGLCVSAPFMFLFGVPVLWLPWLLRRISDHREPVTEGFREVVTRAALVLPAWAFHLASSHVALVFARQAGLAPSGLIPFAVGVLAGPFVLPWFGATGLMKLPIADGVSRSFDAWDTRGARDWMLHGLLVGLLLSWPYGVFSLGDGVALPSGMLSPGVEVLLLLLGVSCVPAAVGIALRYAAVSTRTPPREVMGSGTGTLVAALGVLASAAWVVTLAILSTPRLSRPAPILASTLVTVMLAPLAAWIVLAIITVLRRPKGRPLERRPAILQGTLVVRGMTVLARETVVLQLEDGSSIALAEGESVAAGYFLVDTLPSGSSIELWVEPGMSEVAFRSATARSAIVGLHPPSPRVATPVSRVPSPWLPAQHAVMLITCAWIWSQVWLFENIGAR